MTEWTVHPDAEALVDAAIADVLAQSAETSAWADAVERGTSTHLRDWLDHIVAALDTEALAAAGFVERDGRWRHPGAQLPALVDGPPALGLRVDDHAGLDDERRAFLDTWRRRPRTGDEAGLFADLVALAAQGARELGADIAASLAMQAEREFWQSRNAAARWQHARQQAFGLGWGNHDHHTFRCSTRWFDATIGVLHALGFTDRERFTPGDAGWAAQVLEQPGAGLVAFVDVDVRDDHLGTVGLWCALHGESMLAAGMHHLEGQFDFDRLRADLAAAGYPMLAPFSDFDHLRQAFTAAEPWPVAPERLAALVDAGELTTDRAAQIASDGAPGSHLENLARRGGFKGFNQTSVSDIIRRTDAREYAVGD